MDAGTVLAGRFEVLALAGSGGMGSVYRALDRHDGCTVALKIMTSQAGRERFVQEATTLEGLRHPAIVRYVAHGQAPTGELYLAMEWLEGETLGTRLCSEPLAPLAAVQVACTVAQALATAHARGVIHRDIKPENVFLVSCDPTRVKVLDFGIARATHRGARGATRTGHLVGTPGYMAPEQARGERDVDARVDVFALGCVLFECLTGEPAFVGRDVMAVLAKILLEDAPRVRELRPGLPESLDDLVARMLAKDRRARPPDAATVAAELGGFDQGLDVAAPSLTPRTGVLMTRERRLASVLLVQRRAAFAPTVLDVDVAAPTVIADQATADSAAEDLTDARVLVTPFGAQVERLVGGSLLAILTGGHAATDQAAQAARCALALRARFPDATIALATGRAEVSDRQPVGEAIDRVARLASAGSQGRDGRVAGVRVDPLTADLLEGAFDVDRAEGDFSLLVGVRDTEAARTLLGKVTRCVGREREIALVAGIFDDSAEEGAARAVLVTGAAGMGKSRLRGEVVRAIRERHPDVEVWIGRCDPMRAGAPLSLLASVLSRALGILDGEPHDRARRKVDERLARRLRGAELVAASTYLGEFLGVPRAEPPDEALLIARKSPAVMSEQIREACLAWLRAECRAAPVLLVLEDIHWGDGPTMKLVDALLRDLSRVPFMVVAFARPEVEDLFPRLWADRDVEHVKLRELGRKASESLVRQVLGEGVDAATMDRLVERAAGNAFFLEELIRSQADGRGEALPETVLAMAQMRFERLPDDARRALRAASIVGEVFWRGAVESLLGGTVPRDTDWMDWLVERELLTRRLDSRFGAEDEFAFRHALVRDAAYASLTPNDLARGHALAGDWLENAGEPEALVLANHFERGGDRPRAAAAFQAAATQALGRNDFSTTLAGADRAIALGADGVALRDLEILRGRAFQVAARFADACKPFEAALALTPEDNVELRAEICTQLTLACGWFDLPRALVHGARALELARQTGRRDLEASALASLAMTFTASGNVREGIDHYREATRLDPSLHSTALAIYPQSLYWFGRYTEGEAVARRLGEASRILNDMTGPMYAAPAHGLLLAARGLYGPGLNMLNESIEFGMRHGISGLTARAIAMAGGLLLDLGAFQEAEAMSRRAIALAQSLNFAPPVVSANIDLLFLHLRKGQTQEAAEIAPSVAGVVEKAAGWHGWVWSVRFHAARAELALAQGDPHDAIARLAPVIHQPADRLRPKYLAIGLELRGRARMALGQRDEGLADLRQAIAVASQDNTPMLYLRAAAALLAFEEDRDVSTRARAAVATIADSLDDPALRARFEGTEFVSRLGESRG